MAYDRNNVFAKILRGEIPCKKVHEDAATLAFHDIRPQAPVHVLVIPKAEYVSMDDFSARASPSVVAEFFAVVGRIARDVGVDQTGYRLIANTGTNAHQEVPHFHVHILGGRALGPMLVKRD